MGKLSVAPSTLVKLLDVGRPWDTHEFILFRIKELGIPLILSRNLSGSRPTFQTSLSFSFLHSEPYVLLPH